MAMLPETRAALARYDEWAARALKTPDQISVTTRRLERKTRAAGRRLRNMLFGVFAVMLAAFLYGNIVAPLGFLGLMVTMFAAICVMVLLSSWPRVREARLESLPEASLTALPAEVDHWLESQRRLLPPPAARDIDSIMAQLDRLAPELAKLDPASPMADDARRLVGDHLPRLVRTYVEVPATHRATPEATARLREGLKVVGSEIERMTTTIAKASLDALEVEGKFLENRYQPARRIEG